MTPEHFWIVRADQLSELGNDYGLGAEELDSIISSLSEEEKADLISGDIKIIKGSLVHVESKTIVSRIGAAQKAPKKATSP